MPFREGIAWAHDQALDVQGVLAEAGTHARAAEEGLQVVKQTLGGLEASVQEVIPPWTPQLPRIVPLVQLLLWPHSPPEVRDPL